MNKEELSELFDNMKRELLSGLKDAIHNEISALNLNTVIEEQGKKIEILEKENLDLKMRMEKLRAACELDSRRNNLMFFGVNEEAEEGTEQLKGKVLDLCNNVMRISIDERDLNSVVRIGKTSNRARPVMVSFVANIKKALVLQNTKYLKNSKIYVSHDYDKETRLKIEQLKEISGVLRQSGKNSRIKGVGLVVGDEFHGYDDVIAAMSKGEWTTREASESGIGEVEERGHGVSVADTVKERRRRAKVKNAEPNIREFFRPNREASTSSN